MSWEFTAHVCRTCLGRVMCRGHVYQCADCEASSVGLITKVCACGLTVPGKAIRSVFRCSPNLTRTAANPAAYVVLFDGMPATPMLLE